MESFKAGLHIDSRGKCPEAGQGAKKGACMEQWSALQGPLCAPAQAQHRPPQVLQISTKRPLSCGCFQSSWRHCGPWRMILDSGEQLAEETDRSRRARSQVGILGSRAIGRLLLNHRLKVEEKRFSLRTECKFWQGVLPMFILPVPCGVSMLGTSPRIPVAQCILLHRNLKPLDQNPWSAGDCQGN